jgi:serine/threonine protein phosphatase 1
MRTFVIGDIHGAHKALQQVLQLSEFDYERDTLITLGDICDGWNHVYECIEELLKIKNRIDIKGNHDEWFYRFITHYSHPVDWKQGGLGTLISYCRNLDKGYMIKYNDEGGYMTDLLDTDIPYQHIDFFRGQHKYYVDDNNNLFVHGGFEREFLLTEQYDQHVFWWDRRLWLQALSCQDGQKLKTKNNFNKIFIGHSATTKWSKQETITKGGIILPDLKTPITTPMFSGGVWNVDTGAGFVGKLTIMEVQTEQYWQSDCVSKLYPGENSR